MSSIAIIPARGGSKRIPRKNIKNFSGKPIIAYSIKAAIESGVFDEIIVSTDDQEIADIAIKYGAKVPFFRSQEMSNDMAMTVPVLIEVLNKYEKKRQVFEYCCCIYPCTPFINLHRIRDGMDLLVSKNADSVFPVVRFSYPPLRGLVIRNDNLQMLFPENYNVRSQDLEPIYHDAGQFYCLNVDSLRREQRLFSKKSLPIILPEIEVQDIDTIEDWEIAELKYKILKNV
jgi:N-acylneuraminate cytidylyltransferase